MSKTIKLKDDTYKALEGQLRPRETFDEAVARLLKVSDGARNLLEVLEDSIRFRVSQREQLGAPTDADAVRRDVEARTLNT